MFFLQQIRPPASDTYGVDIEQIYLGWNLGQTDVLRSSTKTTETDISKNSYLSIHSMGCKNLSNIFIFILTNFCWTDVQFVEPLVPCFGLRMSLPHCHQILGNLWLRGVSQLWLQAASVRNVGCVSHPGSYRLAATPRLLTHVQYMKLCGALQKEAKGCLLHCSL